MKFKSFFGLVLPLLCLFSCESQQPSAPNFVFILVDDLGWADLACYGSEFYETPNIDKLAAQGMRFTQAYAASPVCSPTRASILTGKYPSRLNITDWIPGDDPQNRSLLGPNDLDALPLEEVTMAEMLKSKGYKTFFAGKWHLGDEGFFPEDQGFDINIGGYHKGSPVSYYAPYHNPKLKDGPEGEYLSDRLVDESIQFLNAHKEAPFLLYLSFYNVHTPIQANRKHVEHFKQKAERLPDIGEAGYRVEGDGLTKLRQDNYAYASMVAAMDENVGRLMAHLDQLGLSENTVVIFTSDNGGLSTLEKNRKAPTSNEPLRAGKGWCFEGGIRVPLIVKGPNIPAKATSEVPVISIDYLNTMAELAGIDQEKIPSNDGESLVPLLHQKGNWNREAVYFHYPHYHGSAWKPGSAVRKGDLMYIDFLDEQKAALYNLKNDPSETNDLLEENPEKAQELKGILAKFHKETHSKLPSVNPNFRKE
ncbi:sulfatase [Echinicola sp. CAU 1574]|uniref:Sulfatase n=1 Tax=Echinicola arenosa TaxID=2774144 RepID=A0ABR9AL33_9BACT|nr:sulfatase [Echinicola arenosa]MBD8489522.1 sulfatase [Echinicola arenosa]